MTGIIEKTYHFVEDSKGGGVKSVWIAGDDGTVYFGHKDNFAKKSKHYKKGRKVTFDIEDQGREHLAAVNIDVEVPENPEKQEELIGIVHLSDGAYIKRIRKPNGKDVSLLIKDGEMIFSCLPEYERNAVREYRIGALGREG